MAAGSTRSGLAYSVVGSGPPLLWLSGFALSSSTLDGYVARFAEHYTCLTFDPRGSGRTEPGRCLLSTSGMARDALEVLQHAGFDSAHVHGVSLGGMVAQELAIRAPERVRTLVLASTTAGGRAATPATPSTWWSSVAGGHDRVPVVGTLSWRGAAQQALAAGTHDAVSRLGRVSAPTLVMHGQRDRLLPLVNALELAELVPHSDLCVIEGVGHNFAILAPERAAELALDWMARQGDVRAAPRSAGTRVLQAAGDLTSWPGRRIRAQLLPARHTYRALRPRRRAV